MSQLGNPKPAAPCIICHKVTSKLPLSYKKRGLQVLKSFFLMFENYVDDNHVGPVGSHQSGKLPLQEVSSAELLPCPECWRIVQSFCERHEQLKSIEKMLNERVDKLRSLMVTAWKSPSIQEAFREAATKPKWGITDKVVDSILAHQEALIRKCDRKLKRPVPSLPPEKTGWKPTPIPAQKVRPGPASSKKPKLMEPPSRPNSGITSTTTTLGQRKRKRDQLTSGTPPTPEQEDDSVPDHEDPLQLCNDESPRDSTNVKEEPDSDADPGAEPGHPVSDPFELPESPEVGAVEQGSPEVNPEGIFGLPEGDDSDEEMDMTGEGETAPPIEVTGSSRGAVKPQCTVDRETGRRTCKLCLKDFRTAGGFNAHHRIVHNQLRYQCPSCPAVFTLAFNYQEHYRNIHMSERLGCEECGKSFGHKRALYRHKVSVHERKKYPCQFCPKSFSQTSSRNRHMKLFCSARPK